MLRRHFRNLYDYMYIWNVQNCLFPFLWYHIFCRPSIDLFSSITVAYMLYTSIAFQYRLQIYAVRLLQYYHLFDMG